MAAEYDVTTDAGKVRLLISDIGGADGKSFIFEDNEIEAFLGLREEPNVRLAAATALRTMAANEAMVSKCITFLELKTDGSKVSKALETLADKFEKEADDEFGFEIAEIGADFFSRREMRLVNILEGGEGEVGGEPI